MTPDLDLMKDSGGNWFFMTDTKDLPVDWFSSYVKGKRFCDVGAGDGRIVLHAQRCGANAFGIEIDKGMIQKCILKRKIKKGDFLTTNFNNYEVLFYCIGNSAAENSDSKFVENLEEFSGTLIVYHRKVPHRVDEFEQMLFSHGFMLREKIKYVSVYEK